MGHVPIIRDGVLAVGAGKGRSGLSKIIHLVLNDICAGDRKRHGIRTRIACEYAVKGMVFLDQDDNVLNYMVGWERDWGRARDRSYGGRGARKNGQPAAGG